MVVDDYGHHPAEIKATLAAARNGWERRIITVFQPHRYSRTAGTLRRFHHGLLPNRPLVVMDVYAAGEEPIPGIRCRDAWPHRSPVTATRMFITLPIGTRSSKHLLAECQEGDMVITLGAGNVWQIGEELAKRLTQQPDARERKERHE